MPTFTPVAVYDLEANFLGYAIKRAEIEGKLHSQHLWNDEGIKVQLQRLNADVDLRQHWPHPKDPEVLALLDDETFEPIEYVEAEVVDDDKSHYVFLQTPVLSENGAYVAGDSDEIDEEASVIVYKKIKVPKQPTDLMWRIKKACEHVALKRASMV